MALFIQEFYDFLSFMEGKNIATKHPPEKIDAAVYFATIDTFNKYIDHYVKTEKIATFLTPFKRRADVALTGGVGSLPPDYALSREAYKSDGITRIEFVQDKFWSHRINRKIGPVSVDRPIYRIDYTKSVTPVQVLEVKPVSITTCELHYFKKPTKCKYAYTVDGTKYVYDEDNSIDFEFSLMLYPDIMNKALSAIGVNLREGQLFQMMEIYKTQDQRK